MQYYVVQVRTGNEYKTGTLIRRNFERKPERNNVKIIIQQHEVMKCQRKKNRLCPELEKPLLPGYLIIGCEQLTDELYYQIKKVHGVIKVLRNSILPAEYKIFLGQMKNRITEHLENAKQLAQKKESLSLSFNYLIGKFKKYLVNNQNVGWVHPENKTGTII